MNTHNYNHYSNAYYQSNRQAGDRIALSFYYRLARSFVKSGKVLDFGCGTGHLIKRFRKGYEAWAYDISPYALQAVSSVAPHVKTCNSTEILKQNQFDLIVCIHVLEHLEEPQNIFRLFFEILNYNGVLMYVVPDTSGLGHSIKKKEWFGYKDKSHISLLPSEDWLYYTKNAGFKILKTGTDGLWDVPYLPFIPRLLQKLIFYPLPAIQVITGRIFLPVKWGESLIVIAKKIYLFSQQKENLIFS